MSLDSEDIRQIIIFVHDWNKPVSLVCSLYRIHKSRVYSLLREYRLTGEYPIPKQRGRPRKIISSHVRSTVIAVKLKTGLGSAALGEYLRHRHRISVSNHQVHHILLEEGLTQKDPRKSGRRKPWVRYEREESLSAVHMDWHLSKLNGLYVCAVEDDASRMILAAGEFEHQTTENSILLLEGAFQKYSDIAPIREVITDHGSQFYATKRDWNGEAEHGFEMYCKERGIQHILGKYNHPQTNGKIERWFQVYESFRGKYELFDEFIAWYNQIRPHRSLDWSVFETPEKAFYRKARGHFMRNCDQLFRRVMEEGK